MCAVDSKHEVVIYKCPYIPIVHSVSSPLPSYLLICFYYQLEYFRRAHEITRLFVPSPSRSNQPLDSTPKLRFPSQLYADINTLLSLRILTTTSISPHITSIMGFDPANWMSHLDGKTRVIDSYIPGSHDSSAYLTGDTAKDLTNEGAGSITQCGSYTAQLNAGSRFFDMRCIDIDGSIRMKHGGFNIPVD
jgi:hypothetical protein